MEVNNLLYFYFGVMGSGKSEALIEQLDVFKYFSPEKPNIVCVPFIGGMRHIESRNGKYADVDYYLSMDCVQTVFDKIDSLESEYVDVFIDEAQFLDPDVIVAIREWLYVTPKKVTVQCYGLLTNYLGSMFSASATLLRLSDLVQKLERKCEICENNAIMNSRKAEGNGIIDLDKDKYLATCYKCWKDLNGSQ